MSEDLPLRSATSEAWARAALADPAALLDDHAHLERKAAANALELLPRAPAGLGDAARTRWARTLAAIAREEAEHLGAVLRALAARGGVPSRVHKNPYAAALRATARPGAAETLDRLLACALIEARSCERFGALARAAEDADLRALYRGLSASERGHARAFVDLAALAVPAGARGSVQARLEALLDEEARILASQAPGPRMHAGEPATTR